MLKLDVSNISPRSDREATAGTLFQFIVYRNKKGKTRDGLAQSRGCKLNCVKACS